MAASTSYTSDQRDIMAMLAAAHGDIIVIDDDDNTPSDIPIPSNSSTYADTTIDLSDDEEVWTKSRVNHEQG